MFGGTGPFRDGLKLFGWYQNGERELAVGKPQVEETFDRERFWLGATSRQGPWRTSEEWIKADGMIFNGTDGFTVPGSISNNGKLTAPYNVLPKEEADGWYVDRGYSPC